MLDRAFFFDHVRQKPFGGHLNQEQVEGMSALLDTWDASSYADLRWLAYCLATAFHETGRAMVGVEEVGKGKGRTYGEPVGQYGQCYYGRGLVQLTWLHNYFDATAALNKRGVQCDLVQHPDQALDLKIGAAILLHGCAEGWFTGKKLSDYFGATKADPVNARRIVNGLDQANAIASYYFAFMAALVMARPAVAPVVVSPGPVASTPAPQPSGFWSRLAAALKGGKAA